MVVDFGNNVANMGVMGEYAKTKFLRDETRSRNNKGMTLVQDNASES